MKNVTKGPGEGIITTISSASGVDHEKYRRFLIVDCQIENRGLAGRRGKKGKK